METTVIIGGKPIVIKASLGALALYKRQFNEDYLDLIAKPREDVDRADGATEITINGFRLIWAMAKAADNTILPPEAWLAEFENTKGFMEALLTAQALILQSADTGKENKKNGSGREKITTELFFAAAIKAGIGYAAAWDMTIGEFNRLVDEIIGEPQKDWRWATQEDFDKF